MATCKHCGAAVVEENGRWVHSTKAGFTKHGEQTGHVGQAANPDPGAEPAVSAPVETPQPVAPKREHALHRRL